LQPILAHNSIQHICAVISGASFLSWSLSDRIGASYALLALCRESRSWLQLQGAVVERAVLQLMLDACHEVPHPVLRESTPFLTSRTGSNEFHPHHCFCRSAGSKSDAARDQASTRSIMPDTVQLYERGFWTSSRA
jgi:hypothetical protein